MVLADAMAGLDLTHEESDRKIIIAVDFGTTFSGLAWAQTRKPEMQVPVIQWPDAKSGGLEGVTCEKVHTQLLYDGVNYKWGFQVPEFGKCHRWFKLGLDPSHGRATSVLAAQYADPTSISAGHSMSPEKLTTDYLTALRKHAEQVLRHKLPASALQDTQIEYVITVPAVWSDLAQSKTRLCAERAGMGRGEALNVISEPEAAIMYALDAMDPHNIKVGDTFVLCDAGGGTVDLISYKIVSLKPSLRVEEASPGTGMLCGSSYLNRIFQKFMIGSIGHLHGWDDEVLEEAMKRFEETIKPQFRGITGEEFMIPVPGVSNSPRHGVRRGMWRVTGDAVKDVFEPVIQEVIKLILGQVNTTDNAVKAVLMVGGFGQNGYLRDRVRAALKGIEVMQSPNGWTAVVRGALMRGLASTSPSFSSVGIGSRCARKSYGIEGAAPCRPGNVSDEKRRFWSDYDGMFMYLSMAWFMLKGQAVKEDNPYRVSYRGHHLADDSGVKSIILKIECFSDPKNQGSPEYRDQGGVTEVVNVHADLSRIPEDRLPKKLGADGRVWFVIPFEVEITYYSAFTKYELIYQGINYGPVSAEYV